jgi:acyl-CoA dehydrogenase
MTDTEELALLRSTAFEIFTAGRDLPVGQFWTQLAEYGMSLIGIDEAAGGNGGSFGEFGVLLTESGRAALPAPLLETHLAARLLARTGQSIPSGPMAVVLGDGLAVGADGAISGGANDVAWGRDAETVVAVADGGLIAAAGADCEWRPGVNIAGEPRDRLDAVRSAAVTPLDAGVLEVVRLVALLGRSIQLQGAAERALEQTIEFVGQREQFGRPLAKLQAVQQSVASMAAITAAGAAALGGAIAVFDPTADGIETAEFAVLAAAAQTKRTALAVYRTAHQLHGTIGFTDEHSLHRVTTRLMSWRSEAPTVSSINERLGTLAFQHGDAWSLVSGH